MSRLIDADALKRVIKTECNPYGKPTIDFESGKNVLEIIDNAPTIESVDCVLKMFGECSYNETGCSDCLVKEKIRNALASNPTIYEFKGCDNCEFDRPKGKWIKRHIITDKRSFDMCVCSNCRTEFSWDAETGISMDNYNTCPNCGADMRGENA